MTNRSIAMLAPFPPPFGGAGKNSEIILKSISDKTTVHKLSTSVGQLSHKRSIFYHIRRSIKCCKNLFRLSINLSTGTNKVYLVPDGGYGLLYSLLYIFVCKLFATKLVLHYRNYSYIDRFSRLMQSCIRLCPSETTHVFLDPHMQLLFTKTYLPKGQQLTVSNAAYLDFAPEHRKAGPSLSIGLLSNLCREKGLYDFVSVANMFKSDDIRFILAGKAVSQGDQMEIDKLCRSTTNLDYRGEVYGDDKKKFYADCDVILFPTRFDQEAQPNVIWEAMASGCAVIAYDRGSISWMLPKTARMLIPRSEDFSTQAKLHIERLMASSSILRKAQSASRESFRFHYESSLQSRTVLHELLAD